MNEVNDATINEVKATLDSPGKPKPKGAKKVAKKVSKKKDEEVINGKAKTAKKKAKPNGVGGSDSSDDGLITVAQLAEEAEISAQTARVKLRAAELDRGEGRWKWEPGSKSLKAARKVLGLEA